MWPAFPSPDYYESSANPHCIWEPLLSHQCGPSLVHMPDFKRPGEVAYRSLYPCFLQVAADTTV